MPSRNRRQQNVRQGNSWADSSNYRQELNYFTYAFKGHDQEDTMKSFESFIQRNLSEFFSVAEELNVNIKVSYADARSVIKLGGKDRNVLQSLTNTLGTQASNKSGYRDIHQQYIFAIILSQARNTTFRKLIDLIKEYIERLEKNDFEWNIVYYAYYDEMSSSV